MRLTEVIIDGFKSYAVRTVISGWDAQFNAITGLNGSGKSNILDAICFVLGITNLSHVRAGSLQDLIYKQGQAGVTKATVTLVFDNSDPSKSPVGQELCETITVTRQVRMASFGRACTLAGGEGHGDHPTPPLYLRSSSAGATSTKSMATRWRRTRLRTCFSPSPSTSTTRTFSSCRCARDGWDTKRASSPFSSRDTPCPPSLVTPAPPSKPLLPLGSHHESVEHEAPRDFGPH